MKTTKTPRQRLAEAYGAKPEQTISNRRLVTQAALYRPDPDYDRALELKASDPATYYARTSSIARMSHTYYEAAKAAYEEMNP